MLSRLSHEWARLGYEVTLAVFESHNQAYEVAGRKRAEEFAVGKIAPLWLK